MRITVTVWALAFAALAVRAPAQLADSSPFMSAGTATAASPAGANSPELRGIMSAPGGMMFCIYDPVKKASRWLKLNEDGAGCVVKSADIEHNLVTVVQADGTRLMLALKTAKVVSAPASAPLPGIVSPNQGGVVNVVLKPTPEDEQRRLQAIAEEVRRRRLMREQQAQGAPPPNGQADLSGAGQRQQ